MAFLVTHAVAQQGVAAKGNATGFPQDWSHHHVVFSDPGSYGDAMATGTLKQWAAITHHPRYLAQQAIRRAAARTVAQDNEPAFLAASSAAAASGKQNLRDRQKVKKDWSMVMGSNTAAKVGAGQYPAKFTFSTGTANCSDFIVYNTGVAGSSSQPSIFALNNLYVGATGNCSTTGPSSVWAYTTAVTGGSTLTSPVLSGDGTKVAFVENVSSGAILHILKPKAGEGSLSTSTWTAAAVDNTTVTTWGTGTTCTSSQSCMVSKTFANGAQDTNSPPFYNYSNDTLYVGDNSGNLHQFTGVFNGTPTEVGNPWVQVKSTTTAATLTGPVLDPNSPGDIYVGDSTGYLWQVTTGGTVTQSALLAINTGGVIDAPVVDSTASTSKVYVFAGDSNANSGNGQVFQFATGFASGNNPTTRETLGSGASTTKLYSGAFDNTHYTGSGTTGNLYVCGYHSTGTTPRLFQIVMNASFNGTVNTIGSDPAGGAATCSPVTEFLGNAHDWIFLSVTANGHDTGCTGACLYNYNVSTTPSAATAGLAATGGTSGIIIDNSATSPTGASQIYFSTLASAACTTTGTGGCAVQASQSAP